MLILKFKEIIGIGIFREYLGGEVTTFLFFLDFEEEGFGLFGGEDGVATGEENWSGCLVGDATTPKVATDGEPITFDGEERGDLDRGDLGWLGSISVDVV